MKKRFNNSLSSHPSSGGSLILVYAYEKTIEEPKRKAQLAPRGAAELISTIQY
jgi:hypothetical protein